MKMKTGDRDKDYIELFTEMESLYINGKHEQLIELKSSYSDGYILDASKENFISCAEMIAVSYIELGMFRKAIKVINKCLSFIVKRKNTTKEELDDLSIFYSLKLEAIEKQNLHFKQLQTILSYSKNGGKDKKILERKKELQETIYKKYVLANKIFLYAILGIIILSVTSLLTIKKPILATITTLGLVWYFLNYYFHKKIKKIFMNFFD